MKLWTTRLCITFLVLASLQTLEAQDIHFSQAYFSPLNLNPALTGIFKGDQRFAANYRSQWASVPVPYTTFSGAYDQKIYFPWLKNGVVGVGGVFNYDKAGDADLSWAQLGLNLAYTHQIADEHLLGIGFQVVGGQRAFEPDQLTFDDQFNGDTFDPNLPISETFSVTSKGYTDFSAGINWHFQKRRSRTRADVGVGFAHLNQPSVGFIDEAAAQLKMNFRMYNIAVIQVSDEFDAMARVISQLQNPYQESVIGAGAKYHLNQQKGHELALTLGASVRLNDAVIPFFEIHYLNWLAAFSYDINTSEFSVATSGRGGPEFAIRYIISKVKPPDTFKACPIF